MNDNSLIKDIGRSYIVSSFIPAALFITIASLIFKDFSPSFLLRRLVNNDELLIGQWALVVILTVWLGFALYSGWHWTVKLYEGYFFPRILQRFLTGQIKTRLRRLMRRIRRYKKLTKRDNLSPDEEEELRKLENVVLGDYRIVEIDFPINGQLLPTRFGNILRAAENYPFDRYNIESISLFPRLVFVLPKSYQEQLEESNNRMIFLLNSSFLAFLIGGFAIFVTLLRIPCYILNPGLLHSSFLSNIDFSICTINSDPSNFFQMGFSHLTEIKYFMLGLAFIGLGYGLYHVMVTIAREFSNVVRSSFDLYRYDLLAALKIPLPSDFVDEKAKWYNLSNFIIAGDGGISPIKPDFEPTPKEKADKPNEPQTPSRSNMTRTIIINNVRRKKK